MDLEMANLLKDVLNLILHLYDLAGSLEEPILKPLMEEAMNIAKTLKLSYEVNDDNTEIIQWKHITPEKVREINVLLKGLFENGDAS